MNDIREIRLTDSFVMEYWFGELDHDETEIPRFRMSWSGSLQITRQTF